MILDTNDLVKISTYAASKKKSVCWIGKLIERGLLECVKIDGVKFVNLKSK